MCIRYTQYIAYYWMKKWKEIIRAYSLTNTAIHSDISDRRWEPDNITAFWKTLTAKEESEKSKVQIRVLQTYIQVNSYKTINQQSEQ